MSLLSLQDRDLLLHHRQIETFTNRLLEAKDQIQLACRSLLQDCFNTALLQPLEKHIEALAEYPLEAIN